MSNGSADLRRLLSAAMPGPWEAITHKVYPDERPDVWVEDIVSADEHVVCLGHDYRGLLHDDYGAMATVDAELIVAAVNALPALLDVADAARAMVAWEYRMPGAPRFTLRDLRAVLDRLALQGPAKGA
jgi:hypothetical protein